jgi:adenylylsulfate kinase-like enzyme
MKKNKNFCIIIFGLSGSGKSTLSSMIHKKIEKKIGKTALLDGDKFRKFLKQLGFNFGYKKKDRSKSAIPVLHIINYLLGLKMNVLYNNICLNKKAYKLWKSNIKNIIYIYIKTDVNKIIEFGKKKKLYLQGKNVVGVDIKPDIPRKPHLVIENNFDRSLNKISDELISKLDMFIK